MITDTILNLDKYPQIPQNVIQFLKNIPETCGKFEIDNNSYANIEIYKTKPLQNCTFEVHKKYTDIQIIISGKERLDYTTCDNLKIKIPYNEERDIAFLENNKQETASVYLDGTNFVVFFPNEAHRPQMNFDKNVEQVKKIVVKVKA